MILGAFFLGLSKTTVGGLVLVGSGLFAAVLPARPSTGVVLLLLLVGDAFAMSSYARHADWSVLRPAAPWILAGLLVGAAFLWFAGDAAVKRTIGIVLLVLSVLSIYRKLRHDDAAPEPPSLALAAGAGLLSGFMTMVANAGAVFMLYLVRLRLPVLVFLGTVSWFFLVVNLIKLPISVGLGLISVNSVILAVLLIPAVTVGALLGRVLIKHVAMNVFEWLVLGLTLGAALNLLR